MNPEEDDEEDNGEISIHALKEVTNNKIMKVEGRSNGCNLMILIDSRSTHSFLTKAQSRDWNVNSREPHP